MPYIILKNIHSKIAHNILAITDNTAWLTTFQMNKATLSTIASSGGHKLWTHNASIMRRYTVPDWNKVSIFNMFPDKAAINKYYITNNQLKDFLKYTWHSGHIFPAIKCMYNVDVLFLFKLFILPAYTGNMILLADIILDRCKKEWIS